MRIFVSVKPGKQEDRIEKTDSDHYLIRTKAKPIDGKANVAIVLLLSKYFKIPKSSVILLAGQKSRTKVIEIITE